MPGTTPDREGGEEEGKREGVQGRKQREARPNLRKLKAPGESGDERRAILMMACWLPHRMVTMLRRRKAREVVMVKEGSEEDGEEERRVVVSASSAADGFPLSVSVVDRVSVIQVAPRSAEEMEGENDGGGGKEEGEDDAGTSVLDASLLLLPLPVPTQLPSSWGSECNGLTRAGLSEL